MLDSDDLDEAMLDAGRRSLKSHGRGRQAEAEAEQQRKVQEGDHGRKKDVGGNIGEEEQAASLPHSEPDGKENDRDVNYEETSEETGALLMSQAKLSELGMTTRGLQEFGCFRIMIARKSSIAW